MKTIFSVLPAALCLLAACSTTSDSKNNEGSNAPGSPVETRPPNTNYKPAFEDQTRIKGVNTATPFAGSVVTQSLVRPWGIAVLPDGRLLITQKEGTMKIVTTAGVVGPNITGIPAVDASAQGGLLGIALDPAFETNRMIYWTFAKPSPNGTLTAIAKGKLSASEASIENATIIYEATPAYKGNLHYGGRILFDRNGNLFVSTGERSDLETRPQAQQVNSSLGKILHISTEGKAIAGNPFMQTPNARPELYTIGHRNVQGLALHPVTGDLWETEFGPRGGDELNRIQAGKNYGWPTITYGLEYSGDKIGNALTQQAGLEQPVYYWDPVVSPSGITFYTGDNMPEWKNNLFISGLNSNHIIRLLLTGNKVVGEERILANEGQRFRDIQQGKDGALYAITDEGRLYRIAKK